MKFVANAVVEASSDADQVNKVKEQTGRNLRDHLSVEEAERINLKRDEEIRRNGSTKFTG